MKNKRLLVILPVIIVAIVAVYLLTRRGTSEPHLTEEEILALKELEACTSPTVNVTPIATEAPKETPAAAKTPIVPSAPEAAKVPVPPRVPKAPRRPASTAPKGEPSRIMLPNGLEVDFVLPAEGEPPKKYLSGGRIYEIDSDGYAVDTSATKLFTSDFENKLLSLFEGRVAGSAAFAKFTEEEAIEFCKAPIYQEEGDTPEMLARRESVALMKNDILEYIENGGTFQDYVAEVQKMDRNLKKTENEYRRDIHSLLRSGDIAAARQYWATANELLEQAGYAPLTLPPGLAKKLEE